MIGTQPRRTQADRRASTIRALVDATVSSLAELGYAKTTIGEISRRSGVSQGGLFRHFGQRLDLVLAAADEVRARQFANFRTGLSHTADPTVEDCVRLLRTACRAPMNAAWYELLGASRSDAGLRERLEPLAAKYHEEIIEIGRTLPIADVIPADVFDTVLMTVVHLLDGEALTAVVHAHPRQEDQRVDLLVRILSGGTLYDLS